MKRKTTAAPTRIYTYGCLPPVEGGDLLEDQLRRAHAYRNKLVEIERWRKAEIARIQREHDSLGPLIDAIESTETQIAEARKQTKLARAGAGDRHEVAAQRELIEAATADLSVLRWLRGWCKAVVRDDEALKHEYSIVDEAKNIRVKSARASDITPYWGTYLVVEKSTESWHKISDPPKFLRYDGQGRVAVQLQKGLTVSELLEGEDTRLRIVAATPRVKRDGSFAKVKDTYRTVWIRVGSEGRAPKWAKLPFVMHRPLPEDGKIMWAWVIRRRFGVRFKYELQITIEADSFAQEQQRSSDALPPCVGAIDIGSRDLPDGSTRVAFWLNSQGERGELVPPMYRKSSPKGNSRGRYKSREGWCIRERRQVPNNLDKVEDLQSIRDRNLDEIKNVIVNYKVLAGASAVSPRPDPKLNWLREATQSITKWRSPSRISILRKTWQRHAGDEEVFIAIEAYLKQDRHLLDWQENERRRYFARRRELYRTFAVNLARSCSTILIAARDYRRAENSPEEAESSRGHESRKIMRGVAPGELRDAIVESAKKYGARVIEVPLEGDTAWCLDWKVCEQLLASKEVMTNQATSLAKKNPRNHINSIESWGKRRLGTNERVDPLANRDVTQRNIV